MACRSRRAINGGGGVGGGSRRNSRGFGSLHGRVLDSLRDEPLKPLQRLGDARDLDGIERTLGGAAGGFAVLASAFKSAAFRLPECFHVRREHLISKARRLSV